MSDYLFDYERLKDTYTFDFEKFVVELADLNDEDMRTCPNLVAF